MTTILIADDDSNLLDGLRSLFENEGYACICAADGNAALALYESQRPDFCVLDVNMPGTNGIELCRTIRQTDATVPLLLLTARGEETDRIRGFEVGADDYVAKPFSGRELVLRVAAILARTARATRIDAQAFQFGNLSVEPAAQQARRDGDTIELSVRELAVLQHLHRHQGRVVTRQDLAAAVWGHDHLPTSRAMDQFISSLRAKIEPDRRNPIMIRTVWGRGYRHD